MANHFGVNARFTLPGVFQIFEDQHAGSLGEHKSLPVSVEGTAGFSWSVVVVHRQGAHGDEPYEDEVTDQSFRSTGDHDVCYAPPDQLCSSPYGLGARSAGGGDSVARTQALELLADHKSWHVWDGGRQRKGAYSFETFSLVDLDRLVHHIESTNSRAEENTGALRFGHRAFQASVFDRIDRRRQGDLGGAGNAAGFFLVHIVFGVKIGDFPGDLAW